MKFRDPKTGKEFDEECMRRNACAMYMTREDGCRKCPFVNRRPISAPCREWVLYYPVEAARLMGYEVIDDENEHWMIADDGDGLVCPSCSEDFCTIIHETDRFKYCPNCGKKLLPPMGNSDDESKKESIDSLRDSLNISEIVKREDFLEEISVSQDGKDKPASDPVNHPAHYTKGGIECIDALKAATAGLEGIEAVCTANAIKYLFRWKWKGGVRDLDKAIWYIQRLKGEIGNG